MYFKRLELVGFKSFCDKTILNFEPGITAVVGPNGCGKSNIFDSIRWVLGEQSAKSLRGSDMQDVIFNGTDSKEALGMAEVTLAFDNKNKFFNVDYPEVAITRRLFRSGESEYLLNKTQVRLKDILDLLLGTGIGAESYSIVAQGKIDLVLSSRPEDRRLVFDEASGITKYKAQKRETLRKLEETEQNLLRVNDIIVEVKRQIGSLERQASKARRYKEVFEELKGKEINFSVMQKRELLSQKDALINQLKSMETKEVALLEEIKTQELAISSSQSELKTLEEKIMLFRNELLNLKNQVTRNSEHISFNQERIDELEAGKVYLAGQIEQARNKILLDEEKLNKVREEYAGIRGNMEEKQLMLGAKEEELNRLALTIKDSLEQISRSKQAILDLTSKIASIKNEINDFASREQVYQARKKRLDIEKAKVFEEKSITQSSLDNITRELESVKIIIAGINSDITASEAQINSGENSLNEINSRISSLEKQRLTLESQKEFLEKLKSKYEDIGESMNAVIYLNKIPTEDVSGLVIKIKDRVTLSDEDKSYFDPAYFKLSGEAKPIELDTKNIEDKLLKLKENLEESALMKQGKEEALLELNKKISSLRQELHAHEIALANKETSRGTVIEQFNKINQEEEVIFLELNDLQRELEVLGQNIILSNGRLDESSKELRNTEDLISREEVEITANGKLREEALMVITQGKAELEALAKRVFSDEATLKLLEDTYAADKGNLENIEKQIRETESKSLSLKEEIAFCRKEVISATEQVKGKELLLEEADQKHTSILEGTSDIVKKIESGRVELDTLKNSLYELQMQNKDIEYKYSSLKERLMQSYKIDLELAEPPTEGLTEGLLSQEIEKLKSKLDSYGTVNLVAIEEYDELKKRYDFLTQQQADLDNAKESLHQAILKINRTTKQMFLETFEKVKGEFRNYFRVLFNGGDAQVFLTDEQDPLESGIEIICRPPGKKLQNVLLLSGGEKSMSAIALIFAIFKVKPSPFCILDEIDAALDEANVDRFSKILQEFAIQSQFIVITHNKKTIANADVMYGITMEQSGISKIVSVKFAQSKKEIEDKDVVAEAV
ncbi:MAG TPA: AAA family ATPase [Candidatus Margulisiibacteriota bacterium]|nr:AAA family ATPase [Candidatus Margulisiibacteriota bacterium]